MLGHLGAIFPETDHSPAAGNGQGGHLVPQQVFVAPPGQQHHRLAVAAQRRDYALRRRGDAVVDPHHAADRGDRLQAVLHASERFDGRAHGLRRNIARPGDGARRQRVEDVVLAAQPDRRPRADDLVRQTRRAVAAGDHDLVAVQIGARYHRPLHRKESHAARRIRAQAAGDRVIVAKDGHVGRALALEDARLGGGVGFHRAVPVQVVGRHIEHGGHGGAGCHQLELEAAQLHHDDVLRGDARQGVQQHVADVAADVGRPARRAAHRASQRGGGRLARAAGNAQHRGRAPLQEQLGIVGDGHAAPEGFLHDRQRGRHAAAHAQHVAVVQQLERMPAQRKPHRRPGELGHAGGERLRAPGVGERHTRAQGGQPAAQRCALARHPQHNDMLPGQRIGRGSHRLVNQSCLPPSMMAFSLL